MGRAEYEVTYPNYCRKCQGWGVFKTLSPNIYLWDCEECITKGFCPRCGESAIDNLGICTKCGWHRDDSNRGLPGSNIV